MISIIVRSKNEMPFIKDTLAMIKRQSRQDFELICVDSGSTDGSWEALKELKDATVYQIKPYEYIPGKVLNKAIKKAKGEYIVFNNADSIPLDENWLDKLVKPLEEDEELVAVFANQIPRPDALLMVKKDYERAFGDGKISAKWRHFFSLASSAVRTEIIRKFPFNDKIQYSEDIEWSWRMKQMGYKIRYIPEAKVEHSHDYDLTGIKKRYLGEGRAEAVIYRELYEQNPELLSFFRPVVLAAGAEWLRDLIYFAKHKSADQGIFATLLYRFAQRYYAYKGRKEIYQKQRKQKGRILVLCTAFDEGKSGISDYIISVVKELVKSYKVELLIHPSDKEIFPFIHDNLSYRLLPEFLKSPLISMLFHLFILPRFSFLENYEMVFLPAANRRLFYKYPSNASVTFHDLSQLHIKGKYDPLRMYYIKYIVPRYIRQAPHIFAVSESTRKDLSFFYGIPKERVQVNYNGYEPAKLENPATIGQIRESIGIKGKYILYVARIEHPGKNHINLLRAYEKLPEELKNDYELVCAGSVWNNGDKVIKYWEEMKDKARIHFPGFVKDELLAGLYKHASLYAFPSLFEGFGIPMLEAFAAGVPVVCANRSSLPEIGKNAVLTFNPQHPKDIANAMQSVLTNEALAQSLIEKGFKRLEAFSWQRHTAKLLSVLRK